MLSSFPVAAGIGILLGFLSGLGIGGGSLLMLWLTLAVGMDAAAARSVNLLFFLPAALIASVMRKKQGSVPLRKILPAAIAGCAFAAAFSWVGLSMDTAVLKKLFGVLLLATGVRELRYAPRKAR